MAELGTTAATTRLYVNEGGAVGSPLLLQYSAADGSRRYPLCDALGNVTGLANSAGALTDTFDYDAFGRVMARTGTTVTPLQYGGAYGYYTTSFGLINAWHRWYLPEIGKWLSRDPLGAGGNPYTYCEGLPTVWLDPEGLAPWHGWEAWLADRSWDISHIGAISSTDVLADAAADYYWIEPRERAEADPCFGFSDCMRECLGAYSPTYRGVSWQLGHLWLEPHLNPWASLRKTLLPTVRGSGGAYSWGSGGAWQRAWLRTIGLPTKWHKTITFYHRWRSVQRQWIRPVQQRAFGAIRPALPYLAAAYAGCEAGTLGQCTFRCLHSR